MPEEHPAGSKLLPRGKEGIICGYTDSSKIYQVYLKDTQQVKVSHDILFPSTSAGRELKFPQVLEEISPEYPKETNLKVPKEEEDIILLLSSNNKEDPKEETPEALMDPIPQETQGQVCRSQRDHKVPQEWWKVQVDTPSTSSST